MHFNLTQKEVLKADLFFLHELFKTKKDDEMWKEVFEMSIHGADPMKSRAHMEFITRKENERTIEYGKMSEDEAKTYKGIFDTLLNERKEQQKKVK